MTNRWLNRKKHRTRHFEFTKDIFDSGTQWVIKRKGSTKSFGDIRLYAGSTLNRGWHVVVYGDRVFISFTEGELKEILNVFRRLKKESKKVKSK